MKKASISAGSTRCSKHLATFGAVEPAVEQLDVLHLLGEEMVDFEPAHVAVLEPRQLLQEHDRLAVPIAVEAG